MTEPESQRESRSAEAYGGLLVQRADVAGPCLSLEYRMPGVTEQLLLGFVEGKGLLAICTAEERAAAWSGKRLPTESSRRAAWEGARILRFGEAHVVLRVHDQTLLVRAQASGLRIEPLSAFEPKEDSFDAARARASAFLAALPGSLLEAAQASARDVLRKARVRIEKRMAAVRRDVVNMDEIQALAACAPWFVAEAAKARRGARDLAVVDYSTDPPTTRTLKLDPSKLPKDQVSALFARAKRMRQGREIANARLRSAESLLEQLRGLKNVCISPLIEPLER